MSLASVVVRPVVALCFALNVLSGGALGQSSAPAQSFEPQVGQRGKDVIWVPTPQALVDRMMQMAKVTPKDYVIDLGSGDGRTVITAAKLGAKAHGIEYNPDMVELSKRNAAKEGADKATFVQGDIFESDFSQATVVTMFLLSGLNLKLRPILLDMKPGTRVVSNTFDMGDWKADQVVEANGRMHILLPRLPLDHSGQSGRHVEDGRQRVDAGAAVPDVQGHAQDGQRRRAHRGRQTRRRAGRIHRGWQAVHRCREG